MARYIDADALDRRIYNDIPISVFGTVKRMAQMRDIVANEPTVDAVPVVRCMDCTHGIENPILRGFVDCYKHGSTMLADDYCSRGERRKETQE